MLRVPPSPIPCISISLAPHQLPAVEPKSTSNPCIPTQPDSPRPCHLLPPPATSPNQFPRTERPGQLSPLSPPQPNGKGLERARFEAMLKASKERSAMVGAKKPLDLRKEIALKVQKAKQLERRVRFLSKLTAPPSPSAADLPVTPPDSPAVFHFTLPSPGLESPLEIFENVTNYPELFKNSARIEQVDFRLPYHTQGGISRHLVAKTPSAPLPSLDQISQRLGKGPASISINHLPLPEQGPAVNSRLPSFLRTRTSSSPALEPMPATTASSKQRALERDPLALPTRPATPTPIVTRNPMPPLSPKSSHLTKLQITTTICPPSSSKSSPTKFTELNITQFGSEHSAVRHRTVAPSVPNNYCDTIQRAQATKDMFSKLSRRTLSFQGAAACGVRAQDDTSIVLSSPGADEKLRRRISAPAEMSAAQRGAHHPVLEKPGGF